MSFASVIEIEHRSIHIERGTGESGTRCQLTEQFKSRGEILVLRWGRKTPAATVGQQVKRYLGMGCHEVFRGRGVFIAVYPESKTKGML